MKKLFLLVALALALPTAVFANSSVDFSNSGGTLTGTTNGLALSGSVLLGVNGLGGGGLITGTNLGSVSFTTGALTSGTLQGGGTFAGGGSLTITGNGTNGVPNGVIFSGTFSAPVQWTLVTLANGTHNYTLTGVLTGTLGGYPTQGVTVQLTINTGKGFFNGKTKISSGDTAMTVTTPEPTSLSLLGLGAITLSRALRRKLKGQPVSSC
jgi:hypothetical protein